MTKNGDRGTQWQKIGVSTDLVTPPQGLRIKQQSFRKLSEPFGWNYTLEKDLDEEDDSSIDEDDSVHGGGSDDSDGNGDSGDDESNSDSGGSDDNGDGGGDSEDGGHR